MFPPRRPRFVSLVLLGLLSGAAPAGAVVVTTEPPPPAGPVLASAFDALGRWGNNAAAVAVADGWVLTTRHQDSRTNPPTRSVRFGDQTFRALSDAEGGQEVLRRNPNTDLRLVQVVDDAGEPARFSSTLRVSSAPVTSGAAVTLAGFGPTRGPLNEEGDGYEHDRVSGAANANPLRFGTNAVSEVGPLESEAGTPPMEFEGMAVLSAVFDDLPGTTEASVGLGDSGGVWLVGDEAVGFEIAGLTYGVEFREGEEADPATGRPRLEFEAFFGQQLVAVDATPFASRINAVPEPASAALLLLGFGLAGRRLRVIA